MRTVADLLGEYSASHQNRVNKVFHWFCVPLIVLTLFGFLGSLPVPPAFENLAGWLNWGTVVAAAALLYYLRLSPRLALGVLIAFVVLLALTRSLATLPWPLWLTSLVIFVVAWIGQFIGHAIEGKRPSFFQDLQFLLIGPLWLLAAAYRRLGVSY